MAPKKGGGGGGGTTSSSSSTCDNSYTYPCTSGLYEMYGNASSSFYTQADLYGQIVLFSIWCLALIAIISQTLRTKAQVLKLAIGLFLISFIFLCIRYGLIIAESDVPIGYRFESSVVVLLQRLGMIALLAAVFPPEASKLFKLIFYPLLGVYTVLNIAYLILDFLVTAKALTAFKDAWRWRLSDRDAALTLTPSGITHLITNGRTTLSPIYVATRMFDTTMEDGWEKQRGTQIKIGVAADFLALALAVFIAAIAGLSLIRKSKGYSRATIWLLIAAAGLLVTTFFRVVVATHYVLWNWSIVTNPERWLEWISTYDYNPDTFLYSNGTGAFLSGYRTTVTGFPIVQALLEPLGMVIAMAAMSIWWRKRSTSRDSVVYS